MRRLGRTVAFRLALWYAAFFTGCILIAFIAFHFVLAHGIHHVHLTSDSLQELLEAYRSFFGISLAGVALASIFVGWFLARRALSGVDDVRRTAQSIAKGAFDSRVPVKGTGDEVDQLAVTFNGMLGQIQTVLSSMKEITDNIAHDLRSPITRMRGMAELTLVGRGSVGDYETVIGRVVEECDRLLGMINTMLDISEAEAGIARFSPSAVDVGQMARDVIDLFSPVAEDKRISVNLRVSGDLSLQADAQKLQRVLSNLLDNAIKYTPSGGSVTIAVYGTDRAVRITLRDTGAGIPEPELNHIFDRFYRGEESRSEPGNGLGLSLARAFVLAHQGSITITSTPSEGSEFVVTIPKIVSVQQS
jgi:signal transduction histidine kinase